MSVTSGDNGNDDPILPWYRTRIEEAYATAVSSGSSRPIVVVLDPLHDQATSIVAEIFGLSFVEGHRSRARNDEMPSMLVGGWPQDSARHFLRDQPGASKTIDAITATGEIAVFILDGDGPRWFSCPIPDEDPMDTRKG